MRPVARRHLAAARLALLAGALAALAPAGAPAEEPRPDAAPAAAATAAAAPEPSSAPATGPATSPAAVPAAEPASAPAAGPAAPPAATAAVELSVRPGSSVSFHLDHTLHDVVGVSRRLEGRARLLPGGAVEVLVQARVDGFDSGNRSRDAKMLEVTEAARFPVVTLKASGTLAPPSTYPASLDLTLSGEVTFHGLSRPVSVPVRATFTGPGAASATATFPISLASFEVEPPSLLFMVIKDRAVITATVDLGIATP